MDRKEHIVVSKEFSTRKDWASKGRGDFVRRQLTPAQRRIHAEKLKTKFNSFKFPVVPDSKEASSELDLGIYIEIRSEPGYNLKLDSLDNTSFHLCNVRQANESQSALVFIPSSKRPTFVKKLQQYIDQYSRITNKDLFDNINTIEIAGIESFFTSDASLFPAAHEAVWWEVWLARRSLVRDEVKRFFKECTENGIQVGSGILEFPMYSVVLVKATKENLSSITELIGCLSELRAITDTAHFILEQAPADQLEWADEIAGRTSFLPGDVSVLILDSGVNFNHPLLEGSVGPAGALSWTDDGICFDSTYEHGTMQAGLTLYGDISEQIKNNDAININYSLESCRIFNLDKSGKDDKDFFGALTYYAVNAAEQIHEMRRVVSLAVTATPDGLTGQPSSWSSEIDQLAFDGAGNRLFLVSAGNIRGHDRKADYVESTRTAVIEDPAQCWNGLTIGAYTDKVAVSEHYYKDWTALSRRGDVSPTSRTSLSWDWLKHAPYKPDLVAEGGNLLLSPDGEQLTNADCVSLVTTGDHSQGRLLKDHAETSAATALVARIAASVWGEYPQYSAETIRGLLVHSSDWTDTMQEYLETAVNNGVKKLDAKELVLRRFGHGVPSLEKARSSAKSYVTMIHEGVIEPYKVKGSDISLHEMHLIELPWPKHDLLALGAKDVKFRITLSYFIEPNPGRRAYADRFRYQSHGLRFTLINRNEDPIEFVNRINVAEEEYTGGSSDSEGWILGATLRKRGTIHQDTWEGPAADLADRNYLAVYPVAGWRKHKAIDGTWKDRRVRYSLIASLDSCGTGVDLYASVMQVIDAKITNLV